MEVWRRGDEGGMEEMKKVRRRRYGGVGYGVWRWRYGGVGYGVWRWRYGGVGVWRRWMCMKVMREVEVMSGGHEGRWRS